MAATIGLAKDVGTKSACASLGIPRASFYRHLAPLHGPRPARPTPARALNPSERETVLGHLHSERFQDHSPVQVAASLLDEGLYHCSSRTMYRLLAAARHGPQPTLELGHHQAAWPSQVDLLLPLRRARCLQPLRRRLDDRPSRKRSTRQAAL